MWSGWWTLALICNDLGAVTSLERKRKLAQTNWTGLLLMANITEVVLLVYAKWFVNFFYLSTETMFSLCCCHIIHEVACNSPNTEFITVKITSIAVDTVTNRLGGEWHADGFSVFVFIAELDQIFG